MNRRIKSICFIIALLFSLSACGEGTVAAQEEMNTPTPSPTDTPAESTPYLPDLLFDFSRDEYFNMVDPYLEEEGYTKLSDITPVIADHNDSDLGWCNVYIYVLDDGSDVRFYEPVGNLDPGIIFFLVEKDSNHDDTYEFSYLSALTVSLFEGDNADSVIDELGLSDTTDSCGTTAEGNDSEYCYVVDDADIQFIIYRKQ